MAVHHRSVFEQGSILITAMSIWLTPEALYEVSFEL